MLRSAWRLGASMIICSIELMGGKGVRRRHGKLRAIEREDAVQLAERLGRCGEIAVIDIDGAMGRPGNTDVIMQLCQVARCRVGGGLRDAERARELLRGGAESVIVGRAASAELLSALPRERTIVALDSTAEAPIERANRLQRFCGGFVFTNMDCAVELRAAIDGSLTFAGSVSSVEQVVHLDRRGIDAQIEVGNYTQTIDPVNALVCLADFKNVGGLIPTIVCDANGGRVRMLAYSSRESLATALREGAGIYWSRSRGKLWRKGESSGAVQRLIRVALDCDRDALIFYVEQTGPTCHLRTNRCFQSQRFGWNDLMATIDERTTASAETSYTRRLLDDDTLLSEKILEEAAEVEQAQSAREVAWECADLLYFMSVKMRKANVKIEDVMAHLASRTR